MTREAHNWRMAMKKILGCACAAAVAAVAFVAPAVASHEGWYVIMGSFNYTATDAAQNLVGTISRDCHLDARWDDAIYFENMNPNVVFVYLGPYHKKAQANAIKSEAKECVWDTYIKWGRPK
jgi:hypothetical protein